MTRDEWKAKWPNYCRDCDGWGGSTFYESHGLPGPAERLIEPCECVMAETDGPQKCPRCGELSLDNDGSGPCNNCTWDYDDGLIEEFDEEPFEDPCDETEDY